jgi:hypothetical protein
MNIEFWYRLAIILANSFLIFAIVYNSRINKPYMNVNYFSWLFSLGFLIIIKEFLYTYAVFDLSLFYNENIRIINCFLVLYEYTLLLAYFTKVRFMSPILTRDKIISGLVQIFLFIIPITFLALIGIPETNIVIAKLISPVNYAQLYQFSQFKFMTIILNFSLVFFVLYSIIPYYICVIQRSNKMNLVLITLLLIRIFLRFIDVNPELFNFIYKTSDSYYITSSIAQIVFSICFGIYLCKKRVFVERRFER